MSAGLVTTPQPDIALEAVELVETLAEGGAVTARLVGGLGVAQHCHHEWPPSLHRTCGDIDLVVRRADARALRAALLARGYTANEGFNNLHGERRLLFYDKTNSRQLDVFVGSFRMCHVLELDDRLSLHPLTLTPADLLLTKLQIVELNPKDISDAIALLLDHEVAEEKTGDVIGVDRLITVTRHDWGWFTTFTDNLAALPAAAAQMLDSPAAGRVQSSVEAIRGALEKSPKSIGWRARARVGRHVAWYELPEEVAR